MDTPPYTFDDHNDEYNDDQQLQLISPVLSFSPPDTPLSFAGEEDDWENDWTLDNNDYSPVLVCQQLTMDPFPIDTTATDDLRSNLAGLGISVPVRPHSSMIANVHPPLPSNENSNVSATRDDVAFVRDTYYYHQTYPKKTDIQRHNSLRQSARRLSSSDNSGSSNTTTTTTATVISRSMRRHSTADHFA